MHGQFFPNLNPQHLTTHLVNCHTGTFPTCPLRIFLKSSFVNGLMLCQHKYFG